MQFYVSNRYFSTVLSQIPLQSTLALSLDASKNAPLSFLLNQKIVISKTFLNQKSKRKKGKVEV